MPSLQSTLVWVWVIKLKGYGYGLSSWNDALYLSLNKMITEDGYAQSGRTLMKTQGSLTVVLFGFGMQVDIWCFLAEMNKITSEGGLPFDVAAWTAGN